MKIQFSNYTVLCHIDNTGEVMSLYAATEHAADGDIHIMGSALEDFHFRHQGVIQDRVGAEISRRFSEEWEQCKSQQPIQNYDDNGPRNYVPLGEIE